MGDRQRGGPSLSGTVKMGDSHRGGPSLWGTVNMGDRHCRGRQNGDAFTPTQPTSMSTTQNMPLNARTREPEGRRVESRDTTMGNRDTKRSAPVRLEDRVT